MRVVFVSKRFRREAIDLAGCDPDAPMMMVDVDRCISCGACQMACQVEHGGVGAPAPFRPIATGPEGAGSGRTVYPPLACRHCDDPCQYHGEYNFWITCPSPRGPETGLTFCDSCIARLDRGLWPACATRCTMKTIYFGRPADLAFVLGEKRLREMGDVEFVE